jgi:hypothetical protein
MVRKSFVLRALLVLALLCVGILFAAERPADDISAKMHPNLAAAQHLTNLAYDKLVEAQGANEFDMGGHAQKAKDLLVEASHEMKAAAMAANKH